MIGRARVTGFTLAALAAIAILATPAAAQSDYPNRPIQLIVPYGPGVADVACASWRKSFRSGSSRMS